MNEYLSYPVSLIAMIATLVIFFAFGLMMWNIFAYMIDFNERIMKRK